MHCLGSKTLAHGLIGILLFAGAAFASSHRAMNGTWVLVPAQSDFAGQPAVVNGTLTISEREGHIYISRTFDYNGGMGTVSYSSSMDGNVNSTIREGKEFKTKAKWVRDALDVTTVAGGLTTVEHFYLNANGLLTLTVERPDRPVMRLVFHRQ